MTLHLAVRLCGEKLCGGHRTLEGEKVFCTDITYDIAVNPVVYECSESMFIDAEYDTCNVI